MHSGASLTHHTASAAVPIPCTVPSGPPSPPPARGSSTNELMASSRYPGAIKPVQLLQLQKRHVSRVTDENSLFYNCTTPRHKVPPAPLHHTLELQDQASLLSATAPVHVQAHNAGWYHHHKKNAYTAESPNWRQAAVLAAVPAAVPRVSRRRSWRRRPQTRQRRRQVESSGTTIRKSTGSLFRKTAKNILCIEMT